MRQPQSSVLPKASPPRAPPRPRPRDRTDRRLECPAPQAAVLAWLVMVVAAVAAGQLLHTPNIQSYDTGQSGQAERTLQRADVTSPPAEHVLIQSRHGTVGRPTRPSAPPRRS